MGGVYEGYKEIKNITFVQPYEADWEDQVGLSRSFASRLLRSEQEDP
jgi:hypothetical protein